MHDQDLSKAVAQLQEATPEEVLALRLESVALRKHNEQLRQQRYELHRAKIAARERERRDREVIAHLKAINNATHGECAWLRIQRNDAARTAVDGTWMWDEHDDSDLDSLAEGATVVIRAGTLRAMLARTPGGGIAAGGEPTIPLAEAIRMLDAEAKRLRQQMIDDEAKRAAANTEGATGEGTAKQLRAQLGDAGDVAIGQRLWVYAVDIDGTTDEVAGDLGRRARELLTPGAERVRIELTEAWNALRDAGIETSNLEPLRDAAITIAGGIRQLHAEVVRLRAELGAAAMPTMAEVDDLIARANKRQDGR